MVEATACSSAAVVAGVMAGLYLPPSLSPAASLADWLAGSGVLVMAAGVAWGIYREGRMEQRLKRMMMDDPEHQEVTSDQFLMSQLHEEHTFVTYKESSFLPSLFSPPPLPYHLLPTPPLHSRAAPLCAIHFPGGLGATFRSSLGLLSSHSSPPPLSARPYMALHPSHPAVQPVDKSINSLGVTSG